MRWWLTLFLVLQAAAGNKGRGRPVTPCTILVIASMQRSGSTELQMQLSRLARNLTSFNEVFNGGMDDYLSNGSRILSQSVWARRHSIPVDVLHALRDKTCGDSSGT